MNSFESKIDLSAHIKRFAPNVYSAAHSILHPHQNLTLVFDPLTLIAQGQTTFPAEMLADPSQPIEPVVGSLVQEFIEGLKIHNLVQLVHQAEYLAPGTWSSNTLPFGRDDMLNSTAVVDFLSKVYGRLENLAEFREECSRVMSLLNIGATLVDRTLRQTTASMLEAPVLRARYKHLSERQRAADLMLAPLKSAELLLDQLKRNLGTILQLTLSRHDRLLRQEASLRLALSIQGQDFSANLRQSSINTANPGEGGWTGQSAVEDDIVSTI